MAKVIYPLSQEWERWTPSLDRVRNPSIFLEAGKGEEPTKMKLIFLKNLRLIFKAKKFSLPEPCAPLRKEISVLILWSDHYWVLDYIGHETDLFWGLIRALFAVLLLLYEIYRYLYDLVCLFGFALVWFWFVLWSTLMYYLQDAC